jgi:uncharacterized protein (DUF934 family)
LEEDLACLVRERHDFRGELRATGDMLRDQTLFLPRAGLDVSEVKKDADAAAFASAIARYSVFYQPAGDTRTSALQRRVTRPKMGRSCALTAEIV